MSWKQTAQSAFSASLVVEHKSLSELGLLKQYHGLAKPRYLGIENNKTIAQLIAISHNLKTRMNIFKKCSD